MSKREIVFYGVLALIIIWFMLSIYQYSKGNVITTRTTEMKVVDVAVADVTDDTMEITVEDIRGNRYAYYDSEAKEIGTILTVTMQGKRIIDAKGGN